MLLNIVLIVCFAIIYIFNYHNKFENAFLSLNCKKIVFFLKKVTDNSNDPFLHSRLD